MFNIQFSNQSKKFLRKCNKQLSNRIIEKISMIKRDPILHKSVRIVGEIRTFRIRVGNYRVLYEVKWKEKVILVAKIDKRPRVY